MDWIPGFALIMSLFTAITCIIDDARGDFVNQDAFPFVGRDDQIAFFFETLDARWKSFLFILVISAVFNTVLVTAYYL